MCQYCSASQSNQKQARGAERGQTSSPATLSSSQDLEICCDTMMHVSQKFPERTPVHACVQKPLIHFKVYIILKTSQIFPSDSMIWGWNSNFWEHQECLLSLWFLCECLESQWSYSLWFMKNHLAVKKPNQKLCRCITKAGRTPKTLTYRDYLPKLHPGPILAICFQPDLQVLL